MTITATAAGTDDSAAHTITYSAVQSSATALTALAPTATPTPGTYTIPAVFRAGGVMRVLLSINRSPAPIRSLPSTIPAVDPLGPASTSQTSYRPALRRAQPAMRYPA